MCVGVCVCNSEKIGCEKNVGRRFLTDVFNTMTFLIIAAQVAFRCLAAETSQGI